MSIMRSMRYVASGRPAPRYAVGRHFVREGGGEVHLHVLKGVRTAQHQARERGNGRGEQLVIRAHICRDRVFEAEDRAVAVHREFDLPDLVAPVDGVQKVFAPGFDPLDGLIELLCQVSDQGFFRVHIEFASKPAAHFRGDDAHVVFGHVEHDGQLRSQEMGNLRWMTKG